MESVKSCLIEKTKLLKDNLITTPKLEARLLLAKAINKDLNWTYLNLEKKISKKKLSKYEILIKKKLKKFPTAYLLGYKEFYSMNFKVNKNTLIPRPETEIIIEEIKKNFQNEKKFSVLDLGTGTGCILLSILREFKNARGIGIDKYFETIKSIQLNLSKNKKYVENGILREFCRLLFGEAKMIEVSLKNDIGYNKAVEILKDKNEYYKLLGY